MERSWAAMENSLRNLRIVDLEIFITAAQMKNLGKSAAAHHLSQSAASVAIQRVETAFGILLCTHERRQFRLTREGEVLLPKLERVVKEIRNLIVCEDPPIRLVTTHAIGQIVVPALLSTHQIEFKHVRPDQAYTAILHGEADMALVLDNAPWKEVHAHEVGKGEFQLYSRNKDIELKPVLLPEDQMEVLSLQQSFKEMHGFALPVKSRIPSWSLIAEVCANEDEVGFLPDFVAQKFSLHPVMWQPKPSSYRVLAIVRDADERFDHLLGALRSATCFG